MSRILYLFVPIHTNSQPLSVAMAFCSSVSLPRLVVPILHFNPCPFSQRALSNESRLFTDSFAQPFIATSTFIVPAKRTSTNDLHEVKVVSIWLFTFEKSSVEYIAVSEEHPWNNSEADVMLRVSSPSISVSAEHP